MKIIDLLKETKSVMDYVIATRRTLHQYPELSMEEERTIQFVCSELKKMDIPFEIIPEGEIGRAHV